MLVVYDSLMGKTEKFVRKTKLPSVRITKGLKVEEPFILVTYTRGRGEVPETTEEFLKENSANMKAVASSGHPNWGNNLFGKSGITISEKYKVPLLLRFIMTGQKKDVQTFLEGVEGIEQT